MVSTHLPPRIGGVERFANGLTTELERRGYAVDVVTTTNATARSTYVVPAIAILGGRVPIPYSPLAVLRIVRRLFHRRDIPVTVLQTRLYPLCWVFALVARAYNSRIIVIDHSTGHIALSTPIAQRAVDAVEHIMTRLLAASRVTFLAVSNASAAWLREHFRVDVAGVLPNAVDLPDCVGRERGTSGVRSALFAGRLVEGKGLEALATAFERLAEVGSTWRLDVIGEGSEETHIRDTVNVRYHGSLPHDMLMRAFEKADAIVLPTTYPEGLPTIALEAGARGVPVIATARGGLADLLGDGARGVVLDDASPEAIIRALFQVESDPCGSGMRATAMRGFVEERHTWEVAASVFERYLGETR